MRLKLKSIADRGNHDKERIVMRVSADTDVGRYAIFRSSFTEAGEPTTTVTDVFWFPDKDVKTNDLVVLYTRSGTTSEQPKKGAEGSVHFYYWGKTSALWDSTGSHGPVLVHTSVWNWLSE